MDYGLGRVMNHKGAGSGFFKTGGSGTTWLWSKRGCEVWVQRVGVLRVAGSRFVCWRTGIIRGKAHGMPRYGWPAHR
jgi:hypothetical protein